MNKHTRSILFISILSLFVSACASLPDDKILQIKAEAQALASKQNSTSMLQRAKLKIKKAKTEALLFYAPSYFEKGLGVYQKARRINTEKGSAADIKKYAQTTIGYVDSGIRNKKIVKNSLIKSLKHRIVLLDLNVNKHFPKLFKQVTNKHIDLIKLIEQREIDSALKQERALLKDMRKLEIKIIGLTHLSNAQTVLEEAQKQDAEKLLPKTYQKTLAILADAQQYIRQNPRQYLRIEDLAKQATFACERLYHLSRHAKRIALLKNEQIESSVLRYEQQLSRIAEGFQLMDMRNVSFNDQSLLLTQASKKNKQYKAGKGTKRQLNKWERKVVLLQSEIKRMKRALNKYTDR